MEALKVAPIAFNTSPGPLALAAAERVCGVAGAMGTLAITDFAVDTGPRIGTVALAQTGGGDQLSLMHTRRRQHVTLGAIATRPAGGTLTRANSFLAEMRVASVVAVGRALGEAKALANVSHAIGADDVGLEDRSTALAVVASMTQSAVVQDVLANRGHPHLASKRVCVPHVHHVDELEIGHSV